MMFSLIVTTIGRTSELATLFRSLRDQTFQDFEVILADQNKDGRLADFLRDLEPGFPLRRIESTGGASRGRNDGIAVAQGDFFGFPDDDCAFPPTLLQDVAAFFGEHPEYGYLSGRSFADDGRDSVSRHAKVASEITRGKVHSQCIEFAIFLRRSALGAIRFDESMGPGSPFGFHCDEGPDLFLQLAAAGVRGYYDPAFAVWHPRPVSRFDEKEIDRTFRYGCGNGYFYRKHGYPFSSFARQMVRTSCGVILALLTWKPKKAQLYIARLRGRWKGWNAAVSTPSSASGLLKTEGAGQ
jgi:glycosyltransferase involved in cell wall biosynthesis